MDPYSRSVLATATAHGSRLTAHGSRLTAHGSRLTAHGSSRPDGSLPRGDTRQRPTPFRKVEWAAALLAAAGLGACAVPAEQTEGSAGAVATVQQSLTVDEPDGQSLAERAGDLTKFGGRIAPPTYVPFVKPAKTDWNGRLRDTIVVKFIEGSHVRLRNGSLAIDLSGTPAAVQADEVNRLGRAGFTRASAAAELAPVRGLLTAVPGLTIEKTFTQPDAELDERKASGEANAGIELADMNLFYHLRMDEADAPALVDALNASDLVEIAYPEFVFYPAAIDTPPVTPSYVANQTYLNRSPQTSVDIGGVDARFGWTRTGGTGNGVRVVDVEYSWNTLHEDLGAGGNNGPSVGLGFNGCDPSVLPNCPAGAPCHGTAVLGVIRGTNNAYGVTGIANTAQYGTSGAFAGPGCTNLNTANAISAAAGAPNTQVGDVILIELQAQGGVLCPGNGTNPCGFCASPPCSGVPCSGQYGMVPAEFAPAVFGATWNATANGRVVVAAAGNGEQNLDTYGNTFNRSVQDSGAIIVGAGGSTTRQPWCWSSFGSRVDVQGWGDTVRTLGYSDIQVNGADQTQWYATGFAGTSSAAAIVAGVATAVQGACRAGNVQTVCTTVGQTLPSYGMSPGTFGMRELLTLTGTPQPTPVTSQIGPLPNLRYAMAAREPPASGAMAAAKWTSTKQAVFAVDSAGGIELRSKTGTSPWTAPAVIEGAAGGFPAGAPIATGFPVSSELRAFSVTTSGQLRYTRSTSGGAFTTMSAISALGAAPAGANLVTGIRNTNQLHVFFVNATGALIAYHATGTGTTWTGPVFIALNFAPGGAPLATGRQGSNQLDVFAIGNDGALKVAWALDGGGWNGPISLSPANVAPPWSPTNRFGGGVATGRQGTDQLDVFFVGNNSTVQAAWVVGQGTWNGPVNLHGGGGIATGAPLSTAKHGSGSNTLDVFVQSGSNTVMSYLRVLGTGAWSGPTAITNASGQTINSAFSAAANRSTNLLDVVAIGSNGISLATSTNGASYGSFTKLP